MTAVFLGQPIVLPGSSKYLAVLYWAHFKQGVEKLYLTHLLETMT